VTGRASVGRAQRVRGLAHGTCETSRISGPSSTIRGINENRPGCRLFSVGNEFMCRILSFCALGTFCAKPVSPDSRLARAPQLLAELVFQVLGESGNPPVTHLVGQRRGYGIVDLCIADEDIPVEIGCVARHDLPRRTWESLNASDTPRSSGPRHERATGMATILSKMGHCLHACFISTARPGSHSEECWIRNSAAAPRGESGGFPAKQPAPKRIENSRTGTVGHRNSTLQSSRRQTWRFPTDQPGCHSHHGKAWPSGHASEPSDPWGGSTHPGSGSTCQGEENP
jgi:hypothetical protein